MRGKPITNEQAWVALKGATHLNAMFTLGTAFYRTSVLSRCMNQFVAHPAIGKCWEWTGAAQIRGVGQYAYRYPYIRYKKLCGPIVVHPKDILYTAFTAIPLYGRTLHPICQNIFCVRPGHMIMKTSKPWIRHEPKLGALLTRKERTRKHTLTRIERKRLAGWVPRVRPSYSPEQRVEIKKAHKRKSSKDVFERDKLKLGDKWRTYATLTIEQIQFLVNLRFLGCGLTQMSQHFALPRHTVQKALYSRDKTRHGGEIERPTYPTINKEFKIVDEHKWPDGSRTQYEGFGNMKKP